MLRPFLLKEYMPAGTRVDINAVVAHLHQDDFCSEVELLDLKCWLDNPAGL